VQCAEIGQSGAETSRKDSNGVACLDLLIGPGEKKLLPGILAGVKGNPILTVGESEHFVQEGGMIRFVLGENKTRFEINLEAAQKARLSIRQRCQPLRKA
jgi:hypothetical protein